MFEGHIDIATEDGLVCGWVPDADPNRVCHVQVLLNHASVAEAYADQFRQDVLLAGFGHGHYGFKARLRTLLPRGSYALRLYAESYGRVVSDPSAMTEVPPMRTPQPAPVEALLSPGEQWSDDDVLARIDCLNLVENCQEMGVDRFVDASFRYVLGRPVDALGGNYYRPGLQSGSLTPDQVVAGLIRSPDRKAMTSRLPSPHDYRFPFRLRA